MRAISLLESPTDVMIDYHVPDEAGVDFLAYSASDVRLRIGIMSLSLSRDVLEALLDKGFTVREDLDIMQRYPDPLPDL